MIDFKKKLNSVKLEKKKDPCELYSTLDRKSDVGPLRPAQKYILNEWYLRNYTDKDIIVKLHTGEGKTLIGLLMLQSKINAQEGPCLYICPNKYLALQVCDEAKKFGISYCIIDNDNQLPNEFMCGEKILITHAYKVFNGKSIFGINNDFVKVGTVVLDDSHACIDIIKESQSIKIKKAENEKVYLRILSLFSEELMDQGEGSFLDIENGEYETSMLVPYWGWYDKRSEVLRILSEEKDVDAIKFVWPLIKDNILNYKCFISGSEIEIVPYNASAEIYGTFSRAKYRILMSATTQDDSFFVKGLSFSASAVKKPLMFKEQKWSGEKMIIIPSLINEECDRDLVVTYFSKIKCEKFGMIALVPNSKRANQYGSMEAICIDKNSIYSDMEKIKKKKFDRMVVINNRYDGIDLPDECCRILIIDSMPYFNSLADRYEQKCRPESEYVNKKISQKIEQGLGRGVRGEKDYCAILIIGSDIVRFMRSITTKKYFSQQTQKQIDIGLEIAKMASEDKGAEDAAIKPVVSLIKQMLDRDEGWKEYYTMEMQSIGDHEYVNDKYEQLANETKIEKYYSEGNFLKAAEAMQEFIDKQNLDKLDKGWFLQKLARYYYPVRKEKSIEIQKSAFEKNHQLLKPKMGINYTRVSFINENRMKRIHAFLMTYKTYEELKLAVDEILDNLSFGIESSKFELALKQVGELLGFKSQCPDTEIRKGPDNLWCGTNDEYVFFECKSEVDETRSEIYKSESGQMNNHCAWFENEYGANVKVYRYLIIPTKKLSYSGNFTHEVRIIRKNRLRDFKKEIKQFIEELSPYNIKDISEESLQNYIDSHCLNMSDIREKYSEEYYHCKTEKTR